MSGPVLIVISDVAKSLGFEWWISGLADAGVPCRYALLNPGDTPLEQFLRARGLPCTRIRYRGKHDAARALAGLTWLIARHRPRAVHAHLFDASLYSMMAAFALRTPVRVHTRHYSRDHQKEHPQAVKYDRLASALSTKVVAVSGVVADAVVDEGTPRAKIQVIHHGLRVEQFRDVSPGRVAALRSRYAIGDHAPIVGVISRFVERKGLAYIVPAFGAVLRRHPGALLVLANAVGEDTALVHELLREHCPDAHRCIEFEKDSPALYKLFDCFIHTPTDGVCEAFGQTYTEALAAGLPCVFTLSGIAHELVRDEQNALVVPYRDADAIASALERLIASPELGRRLGERGQADVTTGFPIQKMVRELAELYGSSPS